MRKNLLAKSIATMISGVAMIGGAQAAVIFNPTAPNVAGVAYSTAATVLEVNTDNIGHSLFYPYYTVQGDNYTLFSVVNTDVYNGKAIKVRFRGAENSDDVYDITVLLSPGDVWNANITRTAAGIASLLTTDKSCTLPGNVNSTFVTARLASYASEAQKAQSTTEGYIEVFNMADIPPTLANAPATVNPLYTAIKHTAGVPKDCGAAAVQNLFNDFATAVAAEGAGLGATTTGLMGSLTIVNGPAGATWSGPATAVEARVAASDIPGFGNILFFPQNNNPVAAATVANATADPILRGGVADNSGAVGTPGVAPVAALSFDFPDMSTPYLNGDAALINGQAPRRQAYRLSRALAVSSISNEFVTGSGIAATTDWTLSSPTRRYNVARNYGTSAATAANLFTNYGFDDANVATGTVAVPPAGVLITVDNYYEPSNVTVSTGTSNAQPYGVICVTGNTFAAGATTPTTAGRENMITGQTTNTEEGFAVANNQFVISPGTPTLVRSLCGEVSVLSFNAAQPALSTLNAQLTRFDLTSTNPAGWARISTPGLAVAAGQGLGGSTRSGLPIVGSSFVLFTNNNAAAGGANARTIGNYDQTITHRATRY
jgi:hypothetical protein